MEDKQEKISLPDLGNYLVGSGMGAIAGFACYAGAASFSNPSTPIDGLGLAMFFMAIVTPALMTVGGFMEVRRTNRGGRPLWIGLKAMLILIAVYFYLLAIGAFFVGAAGM